MYDYFGIVKKLIIFVDVVPMFFSQKMSVWVNKVNRISVSVWGCAVWKKFPAMAYARTSAGPAGRPGACISQIGASSAAKLPFLAISYLEIAHWSILLRGNGWSPGDTRSGGTDPILSTQRIPRGRDLIFSTQRMSRRRELIFSTHTFSGSLWDFVNEKGVYILKLLNPSIPKAKRYEMFLFVYACFL